MLLLNAALALATEHGEIELGLQEARDSLESGAALGKLDALIAFSRQQAPQVAAVA